MEWFNQIYAYLIFAGLFITLGLSYYVYFVYKTPVARAFTHVALVISIWLAGSGFSAISPNEFWAEFWWYKVRFSMIILIGFFFLKFVLLYTRKENKYENIPLLVLAIPPVILLFMNLSNDYHGLMASQIKFLHHGNIFIREYWHPGPFYWLHSVLSIVYFLISFVLLAQLTLNSTGLQKKQTKMILFSMIFPLFAGIPQSLLKLNFGVDFLGLMTALTCITNGVAIFRYQLFSLTPIARNALIEDMGDAVIVIDPAKIIIDINPAAEKILKSKKKIVGLSIAKEMPNLIFDNDLSDTVTKKTITVTVDDLQIPYNINISPIKNQKEELLGYLIVMRDVSELKELISDLDAYARTVAHDLKNPVSTLRWYIELSQKAIEARDKKDVSLFLNSMSNLTRHMNSIIDELLLFAELRKVEEKDLIQLNMRVIIENIKVRLSGLIESKGAKIVCGNNWPEVISYPQWIEEVLANYVNNAIRFGGLPPIVEIGATKLEDESVKIFVKDNGKGFSEEEIKAFSKEDDIISGVSQPDGRALTLSIVKRIIKKLDGINGVESNAGKGSSFYFILPPANSVYSKDRNTQSKKIS